MSLPPSTKNRVRLASNLMLTVSKVACVYETSQASITGSLRLVKNHCGSEGTPLRIPNLTVTDSFLLSFVSDSSGGCVQFHVSAYSRCLKCDVISFF